MPDPTTPPMGDETTRLLLAWYEADREAEAMLAEDTDEAAEQFAERANRIFETLAALRAHAASLASRSPVGETREEWVVEYLTTINPRWVLASVHESKDRAEHERREFASEVNLATRLVRRRITEEVVDLVPATPAERTEHVE